MKLIGNDSQGFPIYALTLRQVLKELGFEEKDGVVSINGDNPLLDAYPRLLMDDGMGYGILPQYMTCGDPNLYEVDINEIDYEVGEDKKLDITPIVKQEKIKVFNIFRDIPEHPVGDDDLLP